MHEKKSPSLADVLVSDNKFNGLNESERKQPENVKIVLRWKYSAEQHMQKDLLDVFSYLDGVVSNNSRIFQNEAEFRRLVKHKSSKDPSIRKEETDISSKSTELSELIFGLYRNASKEFLESSKKISSVLVSVSTSDGVSEDTAKQIIKGADVELGKTMKLYLEMTYKEFQKFERVASAEAFMDLDTKQISASFSKCLAVATERNTKTVKALQDAFEEGEKSAVAMLLRK